MKYPTRPLRFRLMNLLVRCAPVAMKYYHNSILMRKTIHGAESVDLPEGLKFRSASQEDLDFIIGHAEALRANVYSRRLQRGDRCYCLCDDREVLSYNWVATAMCCVLCGFERGLEFLPLSDGQAFTYDFYTYKASRGSGLGGRMKRLLLQELARRGVREVFSLVMPYGTASIKIHLVAGYQPVCMVYGYRLRDWRQTYFGKPRDKPWLDAWFNRLLKNSLRQAS